MSDDGRTTPLGLFNYGRSYWQSWVLLHEVGTKVSHPDAPVTLLMAHAIELYLKAFLRLRGLGAQEVKHSFGHDFEKLVEAAWARGLPLTEADQDMATILKEQESIRRSRYIESGYFKQPSLVALSGVCRRLDEAVSAALRDAGMRSRSEKLADDVPNLEAKHLEHSCKTNASLVATRSDAFESDTRIKHRPVPDEILIQANRHEVLAPSLGFRAGDIATSRIAPKGPLWVKVQTFAAQPRCPLRATSGPKIPRTL